MQREFDVAVGDIAVGLDPDLYPLLASTQTLSGGAGIMGVQDPTLDQLHNSGPRAGHGRGAEGRLHQAPGASDEEPVRAPLGVRGRDDGGPDVVAGPVVRQVSDPSDRFWDVLTWRLADDR